MNNSGFFESRSTCSRSSSAHYVSYYYYYPSLSLSFITLCVFLPFPEEEIFSLCGAAVCVCPIYPSPPRITSVIMELKPCGRQSIPHHCAITVGQRVYTRGRVYRARAQRGGGEKSRVIRERSLYMRTV